MQPFRTSLTARIVSCAIAFALIGGGLIPSLGLDPAHALPVVILLSVGATLVGLLLGIKDHPGAVAILAILAPLALWPYVLGLMAIVTLYPSWALALVAAGILVLTATALASITVHPAQAAAEDGQTRAAGAARG